MPTLTSDLIAETKSLLLSGAREELRQLNGAVDAAVTTFTITTSLGGIQQGAVLSVDLELVYVWSTSGLAAVVQRGYLGTTAATHANGSVITVNPRFADFRILRAINHDLASYSSPANGLYRVRTVDVTFSAARSGYDLTGVTDLIDIVAVEAKGGLAGDRARIRSWRLIRAQDTADFASGLALYVYDGPAPGKTIRVSYKAPFVALSTLADDVQTVSFLPVTANDIPPLGAAARLVAPREVRRAAFDSAPEPRQAGDVPPGANLGAARALLDTRRTRLHEEAARLRAAWPTLSRTG